MFNFFEKKQPEEAAVEETAATPVKENQVELDNISIHTMPERFRNQPAKLDSAKKTGLAIMGGGVAFLIVASVLLYVFLFRQSNPAPAEPAPELSSQTEPAPAAGKEQPPIDSGLAATTTPATLPADMSLATSTATTTPENFNAEAISFSPGADSDNDGLTDAEEMLLGVSTSTPDTDGDGYLDGAELLNLYDPAGKGKLTANSNIASYENKTFGYGMLYLKAWQISTNGGDDSVMLKTADNQFIQIIVQPNAARQTLDQWYLEQLGVAEINESDRVNGANWQGIKSSDGLTLYLMDNKLNYIFSLTYNPGESKVLDYLDIYQMMIKSFTLKN